jgi:uncharacterized protein (DUF1778 family)
MTTARVPGGQARAAKSGRIAVRASEEQRALIALASVEAKTTVSDFVLTATLARAADVLAERRAFTLAQAQWDAFVALLDQPTTDMPRLRRLLTEPSVLEA